VKGIDPHLSADGLAARGASLVKRLVLRRWGDNLPQRGGEGRIVMGEVSVPTYEYECDGCHCRFERRQGFDAEPVSICPRCQGKAHRVIHSVPVLFKVSGFYSTDHGRGHRSSSSSRKDQSAEEKPPVEKERKTAAPESAEKK